MSDDTGSTTVLTMLPLSDGVPARRFPIVNTAIIVANFAVWLLYELPNLNRAVAAAHGSWDHILGNMLFLFVFGKNVEDAFGHLRYLVFYLAGGFAATVTQTAMTLLAGSPQDAQVPNLGASGAIAAVLGAFFVLYPTAQVRGLIVIIPVRLSAWFFLGFWFLYQLYEANLGLFSASANGGGVAFFAHVGGFVFGILVTRLFLARGSLSVRPETLGAPI
jgi:rhomboid family protein